MKKDPTLGSFRDFWGGYLSNRLVGIVAAGGLSLLILVLSILAVTSPAEGKCRICHRLNLILDSF